MDAGSHTHEELEVLVSAHALDALDPADAAAVDAHLESCESCRAAFDEALETAAALALSVPAAEPPADAARADPGRGARHAAGGQAVVAPAAAPARKRERRRFREIFTPSRNFAAAFAIAAALLGVLYVSERDTASTLRGAARQLGPGQPGAGSAGHRRSCRCPAPAARVAAPWCWPSDQQAAGRLRPAARPARARCGRSGRSRSGGAPVSAGLMQGGSDNVLQLQDPVSSGTTVAITAEPDDGTQHGGPTGSIALSGGVS